MFFPVKRFAISDFRQKSGLSMASEGGLKPYRLCHFWPATFYSIRSPVRILTQRFLSHVSCTTCCHCQRSSLLAHSHLLTLLLLFTRCMSIFLLVLEKYPLLRVDQDRLEVIAKRAVLLKVMSDFFPIITDSCSLSVLDSSLSKPHQWTMTDVHLVPQPTVIKYVG